MNICKYQRGQIWWFENSYSFDGSVQGKSRPAIIISNNKANENSKNLIIIPCTTQIKRLDMQTHIRFKLNDLDNIALCENLMSANIQKLTEYIGTCDEELLKRLEKGVRIALGLETTVLSFEGIVFHNTEIQKDTPINDITENNNENITLTRNKRPNVCIEEKIRFLKDLENHDSDYMIKKYKLRDAVDLSKKKYSYRKQVEEKGYEI